MHPQLLPLPRRVLGPRVLVRPFERGDGPALFEAVLESGEHLRPTMPWVDLHVSVDDSEAYVRKAAGWWLTREDLPVAFFDKTRQRFLGGSGLHRYDWELRTFEIGYWIRKSEEGHGFVQEVVEVLTAVAFERLEATRVEIRCDPRNVRSAAIPRRLGFVEEGCLRTSGRNTDGSLRDTLIFSILTDEFGRADWSERARALVAAADRDG